VLAFVTGRWAARHIVGELKGTGREEARVVTRRAVKAGLGDLYLGLILR
jgi:hypothetical protein